MGGSRATHSSFLQCNLCCLAACVAYNSTSSCPGWWRFCSHGLLLPGGPEGGPAGEGVLRKDIAGGQVPKPQVHGRQRQVRFIYVSLSFPLSPFSQGRFDSCRYGTVSLCDMLVYWTAIRPPSFYVRVNRRKDSIIQGTHKLRFGQKTIFAKNRSHIDAYLFIRRQIVFLLQVKKWENLF